MAGQFQDGTDAGANQRPAPEHPAVEAREMPSKQSTKSPAFQFYPRDFLSSGKVDRMPMVERGAYITLLSRCWLDNGLPTDLVELARVVRLPVKAFGVMWTSGQIGRCFYERGGKFHNDRLDDERKKQADYRRRQSDRAEKRWEKQREADAVALRGPQSQGNALQSSSASSSASASSKKERDSPEALHASTPVVVAFPVVGKVSVWELRQGQIDEWASSYPNADVRGECLRALAWVNANLARRKTAKGMPAFLVNWLGRSVDRGRPAMTLAATGTAGRGRTGVTPGKFDGLEEGD